MMSKGDKPRPRQVDRQTWSDNWERVFNKRRWGIDVQFGPPDRKFIKAFRELTKK